MAALLGGERGVPVPLPAGGQEAQPKKSIFERVRVTLGTQQQQEPAAREADVGPRVGGGRSPQEQGEQGKADMEPDVVGGTSEGLAWVGAWLGA